MKKVNDIRQLFKEKYHNNEFRIFKDGTKMVELQGIQFECDEDFILREPNYDYAQREVEWYESQSLNVYDIKGNVPAIWKQCADVNGDINSNYGWMIWSKENGSQYQNCLWQLVNDPVSRQATMIYNRPSMHIDAVSNHKHDFCCTYAVQCFLNETEIINAKLEGCISKCYTLSYLVYMRSNDAVFGFNNDLYWHKYVQNKLCEDIGKQLNCTVIPDNIIWHAGSLHVYERHFNLL